MLFLGFLLLFLFFSCQSLLYRIKGRFERILPVLYFLCRKVSGDGGGAYVEKVSLPRCKIKHIACQK